MGISVVTGIAETRWLVLLAREPAAAATFYCALFGWVASSSASDGCVELRDRAFDGVAQISAPPPALGLERNLWMPCFATPDLGSLRHRLADAGAQVYSLEGEDDVTVVVDPWGAVFGLVTPDGRRTALQSGLMHLELATTAPSAAERFYRKQLDVRVESFGDDPFGFQPMFTAAGVWLGGVIDQGGFYRSDSTPHWSPYVLVDDVDTEALRALELGGVMRVPPADSPFDRYAVVEDPYGGRIGLSNNSTWVTPSTRRAEMR